MGAAAFRDQHDWVSLEDWEKICKPGDGSDGAEKGKEEEEEKESQEPWWEDELEDDSESDDEMEEDPVERVRQVRYDGLMSKEEVEAAKRILASASLAVADARPWAATWESPLTGMGVPHGPLFHGLDCRADGVWFGGVVEEDEVEEAVAEVMEIAERRVEAFGKRYGRVYFRSLCNGGAGQDVLEAVEGWVEGILGPGGRVVSTCFAWKEGDQGVDENGLEMGLHQDRKLFYALGGVRIVFSLRLDEEDDAESFGFRILRVGPDGSRVWSPFVGIPQRTAFLTKLTSGFSRPVKVGRSQLSIYHVRTTGGVAIIVDVIRAEDYDKAMRWQRVRYEACPTLGVAWDAPCKHMQHWSMCPKCRPEVRCSCTPAWIFRHKGKCARCTPSQACPHRPGKTKAGCHSCSSSQVCRCGRWTWKSDCPDCSPHLACPDHPTEHTRTKCPVYQRIMRATRAERMLEARAMADNAMAGPSERSKSE